MLFHTTESAKSENFKCPVNGPILVGHFIWRVEIEQNFKNVRQRFSPFSSNIKCPAKSQNVRRWTHGSPDKMSGEAQNDFAYSAQGCLFCYSINRVMIWPILLFEMATIISKSCLCEGGCSGELHRPVPREIASSRSSDIHNELYQSIVSKCESSAAKTQHYDNTQDITDHQEGHCHFRVWQING